MSLHMDQQEFSRLSTRQSSDLVEEREMCAKVKNDAKRKGEKIAALETVLAEMC